MTTPATITTDHMKQNHPRSPNAPCCGCAVDYQALCAAKSALSATRERLEMAVELLKHPDHSGHACCMEFSHNSRIFVAKAEADISAIAAKACTGGGGIR